MQVVPAIPEKKPSRDGNIAKEEHPKTSNKEDETTNAKQEPAKIQQSKDNEVKDFHKSEKDTADFWKWLIVALVVYLTWKVIKVLFRALFFRRNKEDTPHVQTKQEVKKENTPHVPTALEVKKEKMINKYGADVAAKILRGEVWLGMDEDQLWDSKGTPDDMKEKQTVKKHIKTYFYGLHYGARNAEKFKMRVTVENNKVIQWKDLDD